MLKRIAATLAIVVAATAGASAQDAGLPVANFQHWDVHVTSDAQNGKVCFVASRPTESLPEGVTRSEILFMVSNRPSAGITNQTYAQMGYPLAAQSQVLVTVDDGQAFTMFIDGENAWLETDALDAQLVTAMRAGHSMVVRGRSTRGTNTTDTYSLSGISAALDRATQECH